MLYFCPSFWLFLYPVVLQLVQTLRVHNGTVYSTRPRKITRQSTGMTRSTLFGGLAIAMNRYRLLGMHRATIWAGENSNGSSAEIHSQTSPNMSSALLTKTYTATGNIRNLPVIHMADGISPSLDGNSFSSPSLTINHISQEKTRWSSISVGVSEATSVSPSDITHLIKLIEKNKLTIPCRKVGDFLFI